MPSQSILSAYNQVSDALSNLSFAKEVEIPIYLVHNSASAEDYTFLIDFERFLREAKVGIFARPVLKVWVGRSDFDRTMFARNLREAFNYEFARMRVEAMTPKKEGWFSFGLSDVLSRANAAHLVGTIFLFVAVNGGKFALRGVGSVLGIDRFIPSFGSKDLAAQVEDDIQTKQDVVDAALAKMKVTLHRELYIYAFRDSNPGPLSGMDHDAWPLPQYVREHLDDGRSSSWW